MNIEQLYYVMCVRNANMVCAHEPQLQVVWISWVIGGVEAKGAYGEGFRGRPVAHTHTPPYTLKSWFFFLFISPHDFIHVSVIVTFVV